MSLTCDKVKERYFANDCDTPWNDDQIKCDRAGRKLKKPLLPTDVVYLTRYLFPHKKRLEQKDLKALKSYINDMVIPETSDSMAAIRFLRHRLDKLLSECTGPDSIRPIVEMMNQLNLMKDNLQQRLLAHKTQFYNDHFDTLTTDTSSMKSESTKDLTWLTQFVKYMIQKVPKDSTGKITIRFDSIKNWPGFPYYFDNKIDLMKLYDNDITQRYVQKYRQYGIIVKEPRTQLKDQKPDKRLLKLREYS